VTALDDETPPRRGDTGQGYPEQGQPGLGIDAGEHPEDDVAPAHDAPRTSTDDDGDPGRATGNPGAAGGSS
jgi:hypothetical protein